MSSGGGGTNTTTTQSGPPPDVLAHYNQVFSQAQNVAAQPQQQYSGPVVAGFSPMQQAGFDNINTAVNAGTPFTNAASNYYASGADQASGLYNSGLNQASGLYNQGINQASGLYNQGVNQGSQYLTAAGTMLDPANFGGTVAQYQSPYTQSVVNATQAQFNNQNQIAQNQLGGSAAQAGAFGGDRQAVAQAVLAGQQQANQAPVIAGLYNTGFQNATNAAQSAAWLNNAAGTGLANINYGAASGLANANYGAASGLANANYGAASGLANTNFGAASGMGNLGAQAFSQGLTGANAQLSAGAQQQAQAQQELNVPYQAFLAAQGYPFQATNFLEGMATGTGSLSGTMGSTSTPGPSPVSQIAGLGVAGVGAATQAGLFRPNTVPSPSAAGGAFVDNTSLLDSGAASAAGSGTGAFVDTASGFVARGGRVGGFAAGGDVSVNGMPVPDMSVTDIPADVPSGMGAGMLGPGGSMSKPTGTVSTTTGGGGGDSTFGSIIKGIGEIAAAYWGGPVGAAAGTAFNSQVHFDRGGGIEDFAKNRRVSGMGRMMVGPHHFDSGGGVTSGLSASFAGNPMAITAEQSYSGLPDEQLREMATRLPPSTPQGMMVQRALRARMMNPGSNPGQPMVSGQTAGMSGPPPGASGTPMTGGMQPVAPGYADGGEPEDDDELPELVIPHVGPDVPFGGASSRPREAGMAPAPSSNLAPGTVPMGSSGNHGNALDAATMARAKEVYTGLVSRGMDPATALGFAANAVQESRADPHTGAGDMGASHGLMQWRGDRLQNYIAAYGHPPEKGGMPEQLDNIVREVSGPESRAWSAIQQAAYDPGARAAAVSRYYERPKDTNAEVERRAYIARRLQAGFGAARGGRIGGFAPGGDVGALNLDQPPPSSGPVMGYDADSMVYGNPGDPSGLLLDPSARPPRYVPRDTTGLLTPAAPPVPGMADTYPNTDDGTLPKDQDTTTAAVSAQPGFGPMKARDSDLGEAYKPSIGEALMAAGFGMMSGTSPHALTNIGAGGLAGLKNYQTQRQLMIQDQARRDAAETNRVWRLNQAVNNENRTDIYGRRVDAQGRVSDAQAGLASARTAAIPDQTQNATTRANAYASGVEGSNALRQARADKLAWDQSHGDATLAERQKHDADVAAFYGVRGDALTANAAANTQRAATGQQKADTGDVVAQARIEHQAWVRSHGDATAAQKAQHDQDLATKYGLDRDQRAAIAGANLESGLVKQSNPLTGKPARTEDQARQLRERIQQRNQPAAMRPAPPSPAPAQKIIRYDANGEPIS